MYFAPFRLVFAHRLVGYFDVQVKPPTFLGLFHFSSPAHHFTRPPSLSPLDQVHHTINMLAELRRLPSLPFITQGKLSNALLPSMPFLIPATSFILLTLFILLTFFTRPSFFQCPSVLRRSSSLYFLLFIFFRRPLFLRRSPFFRRSSFLSRS